MVEPVCVVILLSVSNTYNGGHVTGVCSNETVYVVGKKFLGWQGALCIQKVHWSEGSLFKRSDV
jgi:hypothetical protein